MAGADGSLWPIVVGGVLTGVFALGGVFVSQKATARRDAMQELREAAKKRADKFEELVAAVYEFDHWLNGARQGKDAPETVSPFAKVQSIPAIYFPQFSALVSELDDAADQCIVAIYAAKLSDPSTYSKEELRQAREELGHANVAFAQKREALLDALKKFAHEHFQ